MVSPYMDQVVTWLTEKGYRAYRGYPTQTMPQITGIHVAVVVHKAEPNAVTYKAIICGPKSRGLSACENVAEALAMHWGQHGGKCTWGDGEYNETMGAFTVEVFGCWEYPVVEEE